MLKLPKNYLSYSSVSCFNKTTTRRDWIKRYIYKEQSYTTPEMAFGRRVSENLEHENMFNIDEDLFDVLSEVQREGIPETNLVLQQYGFYVTAYLDRCTKDYKKVTEYKTGKGTNPKGEFTGWDQERVNNHKQLDVYSWMIFDNFGFIPECELIWMETESIGKDVRFTGRKESFKRTLTPKEIHQIQQHVNDTAHEMEKVYKLYLDGHDLLTDAKYARELIKSLAA